MFIYKFLFLILRCPECDKLARTWEILAQDLHNRKNQPVIAQVNCGKETSLCGKGVISHFRLLLFYYAYLIEELFFYVN